MTPRRAILLLALLCTGSARAAEDDWFRPLGLPPKASPRRISAGESFPPLPLPATPLRRSERKREPSPPTLVGKIVWGETASFAFADGAETRVSDWNLCPGDLQQLMRKGAAGLGLSYGSEEVNLATFEADPGRTPILLANGGRRLKLEEDQVRRLREFVLGGGMLLFDSIAGSPYFYDSAKALVTQAFPEFAIRVIPPDHPAYHTFYDVETVAYPKNLDSTTPFLEGIYVGARLGVVISKYGLGCGWDNHEVPLIEQAIYYDVESANRIGLNLIGYAIGYASVAREQAKPELFGSIDETHPTDEFVFAQIRHEGAWNVHPGGAAKLLRRLRQSTALRVSLKRTPVSPAQDDLSPYTFLYLTGLDDFQFGERERSALRHFLKNGGTLFVNNGLGLGTFDRAARREIQRLLPESELAPLPADHPLYSAVFRIDQARYTPALQARQPDLARPWLEGIVIDGDMRVLYSPYDLEAAWQGLEYPLALAYEPDSGLQLGVNLVMYAMTH